MMAKMQSKMKGGMSKQGKDAGAPDKEPTPEK
jgi:hypothetical protein